MTNYCVLASHKTMPVPMEILTADPELDLSGYLCPAHVSTVIGGNAYRHLAEKYHIPCVVTGFEPADVMQGIEMLLAQILAGESRVEIQYSRAVSWEGNPKAQRDPRPGLRTVRCRLARPGSTAGQRPGDPGRVLPLLMPRRF